MPQHALRREDNQRLAPVPHRLTSQQMKILCRGRRLRYLNIVARDNLQIALHACAGVLRSLPFISMRQQQHQPAQQSPFVFCRGKKLIDDDLRAVGEVAKLRFPQHQGFRIIAAEAILETHHSRLRQHGVVDFELRLAGVADDSAEQILFHFRYRSTRCDAD